MGRSVALRIHFGVDEITDDGTVPVVKQTKTTVEIPVEYLRNFTALAARSDEVNPVFSGKTVLTAEEEMEAVRRLVTLYAARKPVADLVVRAFLKAAQFSLEGVLAHLSHRAPPETEDTRREDLHRFVDSLVERLA